jgi:hypothetical protein
VIAAARSTANLHYLFEAERSRPRGTGEKTYGSGPSLEAQINGSGRLTPKRSASGIRETLGEMRQKDPAG